MQTVEATLPGMSVIRPVAPRSIDRMEKIASNYARPIGFSELPAGKTIIEKGGFTPKTRELEAMREDISVAAYEFLQNLSYGLKDKPPPIVLLELKDGRRIPFTGDPDDWPDDNSIVSCQFITSCDEGITVSEAVISAHDETKQGLGFWGRGLKHAAAFLLDTYGKAGTEIEINASYTHAQSKKRHSWVGRYSLDETTDGRNQQLNVHWAEVDQLLKQTIVTIRRPPREFMKAIKASGSTFLPMNPGYRGGLYVPGKGEKNNGVKYSAEIGGLQVELLQDDLISNMTFPTRAGFVDGTRFEIGRYDNPLMFPWHFAGGLDASKVKSWARIHRGEDSKAVRNVDSLNLVLRAGLNEGSLGADFWDNFLERMYQQGHVEEIGREQIEGKLKAGDRDIPLELKSISSWNSEFEELTPTGKKNLQRAWDLFSKRHPDVAAINDSNDVDFERGEHRTHKIDHKYKVLICHGLYRALSVLDKPPKSLTLLHEEHIKEASIKAEPIERFQLTPVMEVETKGELPSIYDAFRILGTQEGVELTEEDGRLYLAFSRDIGVYYFKGKPENMFPGSQEARQALAAIVAGVSQRQGEIAGTYIEAGSNIARFKLVSQVTDKKAVLLATGEVKDTFKDTGTSKLQFEIKMPSGSRADIQKCLEYYGAGQAELESKMNHMSHEEQILHAAQQAESRAEKAEKELHLIKARIEEEVAVERREMLEKKAEYEKMLRKLEEGQEAVRQQARDLQRQVIGKMLIASGKLTAAAASTGVGGLLFKEFVLPRLAASHYIQNGALAFQNGIEAISDRLKIPTILGEITATKAEARGNVQLYWGLNSDSMALDAGDITYLAPEVIQAMQQSGRSRGEFILPEEKSLEYRTGGTMVYVEGMTPGYDTGGYYRTTLSNTMSLNRVGNFVEGTYEGEKKYQNRDLVKGRPKQYQERQVYKAKMPIQVWVPLALRLWEVPIGYAGVDSAQFRQDTVTGGWEVNISSNNKELVVYTGQAAESDLVFLKREPAESDKAQLLDMNTLRPDIKNAIETIASSNLTEAEKIAEVLAVWRRVYLYDKGRDVKENFPMDNLQVYTSAMINKGLGPCGYAAYGAQALLRAAGVATNVVGSLVNESYGPDLVVDELHATILVWSKDSKQWYHIEPQIGRATARFQELEAGRLLNQVQVADSVISRVSPQAQGISPAIPDLVSVSQTDPQLALSVRLSEGQSIFDLPALRSTKLTQEEFDKIIKQVERERQVEVIGPYAFAGTAGAVSMALSNFIHAQIKARLAKAAEDVTTVPDKE